MEATDVTNAPQFPSLLITVVYLDIYIYFHEWQIVECNVFIFIYLI